MAFNNGATGFAFYGGTAHSDAADIAAAWHWQSDLCRALISARGGQVTAWFFDTACRADVPLPDRPQGRLLLAALTDPRHGVDAVVSANAVCTFPRRPARAPAGIPRWPVPLMLADTDITISSPAEYDLVANVLLGLSKLQHPGHPEQGSITRRAKPRPGRLPAHQRSSPPRPGTLPPGAPAAGTAGEPR